MTQAKKTKEDPLKDLTSFLDVKFKPKPEDIKPEMMSDIDMSNFFAQKITPVYKKIKNRLASYNFEVLYYDTYRRVASFKIADTLSIFVFKVDIHNGGRQVRIFYELKYRLFKRRKLSKINTIEYLNIPFNKLDKINDDMLLTLFTKWYMNKDEVIQKDKETLSI